MTLVAGFHLDDSSTFGTEVNPRVGMAYRLPAIETKLRASYGTGIKAPSFFENFVSSPFVVGNPKLDPERSESWAVGFDQPLPFDDYPADLSVTYFSRISPTRLRGAVARRPLVRGSPSLCFLDLAAPGRERRHRRCGERVVFERRVLFLLRAFRAEPRGIRRAERYFPASLATLAFYVTVAPTIRTGR